jgi:hypothetical protein
MMLIQFRDHLDTTAIQAEIRAGAFYGLARPEAKVAAQQQKSVDAGQQGICIGTLAKSPYRTLTPIGTPLTKTDLESP